MPQAGFEPGSHQVWVTLQMASTTTAEYVTNVRDIVEELKYELELQLECMADVCWRLMMMGGGGEVENCFCRGPSQKVKKKKNINFENIFFKLSVYEKLISTKSCSVKFNDLPRSEFFFICLTKSRKARKIFTIQIVNCLWQKKLSGANLLMKLIQELIHLKFNLKFP